MVENGGIKHPSAVPFFDIPPPIYASPHKKLQIPALVPLVFFCSGNQSSEVKVLGFLFFNIRVLFSFFQKLRVRILILVPKNDC